MTATDVWCATPDSSGGWGPITALAHLAARLWHTEPVFIHPSRPYGHLRKLLSMTPRRRAGDRNLLIIAAHPGDLLSLARPGMIAGRYDVVGAWIIDSFWTERIPRFARERHSIDHVWVTDGELVDHYSNAMGLDARWLPWGTDALLATSNEVGPKPIDVFRLGRQPAAWDDDELNAASLAGAGISYQGRFPLAPDGAQNQRLVIDHLLRSKVVLASSSLASPADYAHPSRDYISARFTDAVACGTRIAGQRPRCQAADLIPDAAWIELPAARDEALAQLRSAVSDHTNQRVIDLQIAALDRLDWRHRLRAISDTLGSPTAILAQEMDQLTMRVGALRQGVQK
ncbi:hypothetical protein [Calidifontibacter terrae]